MDIEYLMSRITAASNHVGNVSRRAENISTNAGRRIQKAADSIEGKADLIKKPMAKDVLRKAGLQ